MENNNDIHKAIPQLRFPVFKNENEWDKKRLGDVITTITPSRKLQSNEYKKKGAYPIIDQSKDFICGYSDDRDALLNTSREGLIVFGDHTCVLKYVDFPFVQGADGIKIFKPTFSNEINERFLYQALLYHPVVSQEYKRHFSELKDKHVFCPRNILEQYRVAEFLFVLDEMMASTNEKLEFLKEYKKGLMQKLFPAKDKTMPEFRFKEFEKDGEWEVKKLGDIITEVKDTTNDSVSIPLYSLTIDEGITAKTERYERGFLVTKKDNVFKVVLPNDFVSNPMNLRFGAIGCNHNAFSVCVSGYYDVFRFKESGSSVFWVNYLKSDLLLHKYDEIAIGSLIEKRRVYYSNLQNLSVLVPSIQEQRKIANCLSLLDETISAHTEEIAQLGQYKKGLMQQMFPNFK